MMSALKTSVRAQLAKGGMVLGGLRLTEEVTPEAHEIGPIYEILIHALTNAVDHGFLLPSRRGWRGETLAFFEIEMRKEGDRKILSVRDNGHGLDHQAIQKRAMELGWSPLEEGRWTDVLFEDGVSTAGALSKTSGRGVGLSAIQSVVGQLGGSAEIKDRDDRRGTCLIMSWNEVDIQAPKSA